MIIRGGPCIPSCNVIRPEKLLADGDELEIGWCKLMAVDGYLSFVMRIKILTEDSLPRRVRRRWNVIPIPGIEVQISTSTSAAFPTGRGECNLMGIFNDLWKKFRSNLGELQLVIYYLTLAYKWTILLKMELSL